MTLNDKLRLAEEALQLARETISGLHSARDQWTKPGCQAYAQSLEWSAIDSAKRAAILLEQVARE